MSSNGLAEATQPVVLLNNQTTNGGVTSDYISLKNCAGPITIYVMLDQAAGHATAITPKRATAVAPTGSTTLANAVNIWANEATQTADGLTRQTSATSFTVNNSISEKLVVFEIDPSELGEGYDCFAVTLADSSQATNFATILAVNGCPKYAGASPPSMIID